MNRAHARCSDDGVRRPVSLDHEVTLLRPNIFLSNEFPTYQYRVPKSNMGLFEVRTLYLGEKFCIIRPSYQAIHYRSPLNRDLTSISARNGFPGDDRIGIF